MVFGDFDADGLTGLAILVLALRRLGMTVEPYVPSRLEEGHGLSLAAVDAARPRTASPSSSPSTPDDAARPRSPPRRERGIDVIVTDHHRRPADLPPARRARQPAPGRLALPGRAPGRQRRRVQGRPAAPRGRAGRPRRGPRPRRPRDDRHRRRRRADRGREPLDRAAGPRADAAAPAAGDRGAAGACAGRARRTIDLETIGFVLAPRLNAAGRVGEALEAARLLLAEDAGRRRPMPTRSRRPTRPGAT